MHLSGSSTETNLYPQEHWKPLKNIQTQIMSVQPVYGNCSKNQPFSKIADEITKNGFQLLPIGFEDVLQLTALSFFHKDPFDRLIIAQAITSKLQVISKDQYFTEYPIDVIW